MTRQEKKNLLKSYTGICEKIADIQNQLEEIRASGEKVTQSFSGSGGAFFGNDSKVERAALKVPEMEARLQKYEKKKEKIDIAVNSLRRSQRELIRQIYFDNVSQNRVAQLLHKTPNSIRATVNKAVDDLLL